MIAIMSKLLINSVLKEALYALSRKLSRAPSKVRQLMCRFKHKQFEIRYSFRGATKGVVIEYDVRSKV